MSFTNQSSQTSWLCICHPSDFSAANHIAFMYALNEQGVIAPVSQWIAEENECITVAVEKTGQRPKGANLRLTHLVKRGDPKRLFFQEAECWGADGTYVDAQGMRFLKRILFGSVSSAVSALALLVKTERQIRWIPWTGSNA